MRKGLAAIVIVSVLAVPTVASAADSDNWMVRVRALKMSPANESDPIPGLAPADAVHVDDKVFPEVDFSYFFNSNLAMELILTYPQKHDVTLEGTGKIGTVKHLPPTLTLQWHFHPSPTVTPYVGAGLNYTRFSSVSLSAAGLNLDLEKSSTGLAYQLGVDIEVAKNRFLNFDWKRVNIESDVINKADGSKVTHINIDPDLFSIGYGWRF